MFKEAPISPIPPMTPEGSESRSNYESHAAISLDVLLHNRLEAPLSLHDFTVYLNYVEHSVENLEFWDWFQAYKQFYEFSEKNPNTTNPFSPLLKLDCITTPITSPLPSLSSPTGELCKSGNQTSIYSRLFPNFLQGKSGSTLSQMIMPVAATPAPPSVDDPTSPEISSKKAEARKTLLKLKLIPDQPSTPMIPVHLQYSDIVQSAIDRFLSPASRREINIPERIKLDLLQKLEESTHPSAFLPAATHIYTLLRNSSLPGFLNYAAHNSVIPSTRRIRLISATMILIALIVAYVVLITNASPWYFRAVFIVLWLPLFWLVVITHAKVVWIALPMNTLNADNTTTPRFKRAMCQIGPNQFTVMRWRQKLRLTGLSITFAVMVTLIGMFALPPTIWSPSI